MLTAKNKHDQFFSGQVNDFLNQLLINARLSWFRRKRYKEIHKLNLIYHIAPIQSNNVWRDNVRLLSTYFERFDRIILGVVTGEGMVPFEKVQHELGSQETRIEWIVKPNCPKLGEMATFPTMLSKIASTDASHATFYGHTKGVSRPGSLAVEMWKNSMYHACLFDTDRIKKLLRMYACAGPFKKRGQSEDWQPVRKGHFHFAGTFFWFRNDQVFSNPKWQELRYYRYGVEEYLGSLIDDRNAACLFGEYAGNLYSEIEHSKCRNFFFTASRFIGHSLKNRLSHYTGHGSSKN